MFIFGLIVGAVLGLGIGFFIIKYSDRYDWAASLIDKIRG